MSQQPVPAPKRPLSKGKKIAIGIAVLVAAPPFIAGMVSGVKSAAHQDNAAAAASSAPSHGHSGSKPASKVKPAPAAHTSTPGPAQKLADLDGNSQPVSVYQRALDSLAPKCTQDREHIAGIANATLQDLQKNGVTDESELSVLQHLGQSIPAGSSRTDCVSIAAAYATLREG